MRLPCGLASSGAVAAGRLYYASGATTINGTTYRGVVTALNPATGGFLWRHTAPGVIVPAIAYANGLIIDDPGPTMEVINAATGAPLYSYTTGGTLYGPPSVSNGQILQGSTDGYVYAFGLSSTPASPTPAPQPAPAGSFNLQAAYNNVGISNDSYPGGANIDGVGYSYSAQALQSAGFGQGQNVTVNGVAFQWPNAAPGAADNVAAQGQTVRLGTPTAGATLAVLGTATNGPSTGAGTITYGDGSTQSFSLGFSDWTLNAGAAHPVEGNSVAATLSYRNGGGGRQTIQTYVFYTSVALQAGKAVASVTLPASTTQGQFHVFAMTVSGTPTPPSVPTGTPTPPSVPTGTPTPPSVPTGTPTPPSVPTGTPTPPSVPTTIFATGFEGGDPQPTWNSTVDGGYPAGGLSNVGGICCGLSGPETGVRGETAHTGGAALMYSGADTSASSSYAYDKVLDLSGKNVAVGSTTTLSYWIYPQSGATSPVPVGGSNSTCVALDLIFTDGSNLRDSGATDQAGTRVHPAYQCGHLTLNAWNHVTSVIGAKVAGKTISRIDVGYDQPANTGGYRGYIDDISLHN